MIAKPFTELYLPKFSSGLSIIGSSIILAEVIMDVMSEKGASSISQILLSVSIGDILFSV
jgi:hypothetical protein